MPPLSRLQALLLPLTNMGLRGIGLVGRFVLSFYLIKFLPLEVTGQFGLVTGVVGVLPAVLGLGINFYMLREIISIDIREALLRVRDKLIMMSFLATIIFLCSLVYNLIHPINIIKNIYLVGAVVILEILAFDIHYVLISLRKPLLANFLLVVRSSAWVFPFIALTYFCPQYRNLETLLAFWLGSLVSAYTLLWMMTRQWPWGDMLGRGVDFKWLLGTVKVAVLIYLSDIGIVAFSFFDRFFVAARLGLESTAVYTFYWTMANALLVLMTAAVTQVSLPALVDAFNTGEENWKKRISVMLCKAAIGSVVVAAAMYAGVSFLLPYLGNANLSHYPLIFPLMLAAIAIRIVADMVNYGLYSRNRDKTLALINIAGIGVNVSLTVVMVSLFGLIGVTFSMLGTALFLLGTRAYFLSRDVARVARLKAAEAAQVLPSQTEQPEKAH